MKKCPLCGGELQHGQTAAPFFIDEKIIIIKDVPAEVCADCGEAFTKSSVAGRIEDILDKVEKMSVVHFKADFVEADGSLSCSAGDRSPSAVLFFSR